MKKLNILLRQIHRWGSLVVALPIVIMIGAGILLMLKKDAAWIQPPTQRGSMPGAMPAVSLDMLFAAAQAVPEAGIGDWRDLERVDIKPDRGVIKFVSADSWEVQVDTATGAVLQVAYRRSDLIESIHDGSFFAGWTKLYVFLPAGVVLFLLWLSGLYLFFLPYAMRSRRGRRRRPLASGLLVSAGQRIVSPAESA